MSPEGVKRRPWYAAALVAGAAAGATIAAMLSHQASAAEPERLTRIEDRLNNIERAVGRIEGKLERR